MSSNSFTICEGEKGGVRGTVGSLRQNVVVIRHSYHPHLYSCVTPNLYCDLIPP